MGVKTHPWLADEPMAIKAIPEPQQDWGQWPGLCPWAGHEDIHDTSPAEGALARSWWQQGHTAPVPDTGWGKPPWPGGHQRAAGPRHPRQPLELSCHLPVVALGAAGSSGFGFGPAAAPGGEMGAASPSHQLGLCCLTWPCCGASACSVMAKKTLSFNRGHKIK